MITHNHIKCTKVEGQKDFQKVQGRLMALGCNPAQKEHNVQEGFAGYLKFPTNLVE